MANVTPLVSAEVGSARLDVCVADITTLALDAIVNAANRTLLGGGGVDGAIHRVAGPELLAECRTLDGCETGGANYPRLSVAGKARHPRGRPGLERRRQQRRGAVGFLLSDRARSCRPHRLASVAFPAISTGIYRFPPDRAARIAVGTVTAELASSPRGLANVVFCCFARKQRTTTSALLPISVWRKAQDWP